MALNYKGGETKFFIKINVQGTNQPAELVEESDLHHYADAKMYRLLRVTGVRDIAVKVEII